MHTHLHNKASNNDKTARRMPVQAQGIAAPYQDKRTAFVAQQALQAAIQKKNDRGVSEPHAAAVAEQAQHVNAMGLYAQRKAMPDGASLKDKFVPPAGPDASETPTLQGKFETIQRAEKAKIVTSVGNQMNLSGWDMGHVNQAGNVEFKLVQVNLKGKDYWVGGEMIAHAIGPHHPQGGPPGGSELSDIMSVLPTEPKNTAEKKYIKGHLLNDNLGGPGTQPNLFPITAAANKQHENQVESYIKHWVNEKGYWVYYRVKVDNIQKEDRGSWEALNASFVCEAAPLSANGKQIPRFAFKKTIVSKLDSVEDFIPGIYLIADPEMDNSAGQNVAAGFDKEKVVWSTTKGDATLPQTVEDEITMKSETIMKLLSPYIGGKENAVNFIEKQLSGVGVNQNRDILTRMILDPYFEIDHTHLALRNSSDIAVWNNMVNLINQNKAKILEWLGNIESELNEQKNKELLEQTQKENQRRLEREVNKLLNKHRPQKFEREKKLKGVNKTANKKKVNNAKAKVNIVKGGLPKVINKN